MIFWDSLSVLLPNFNWHFFLIEFEGNAKVFISLKNVLKST